MHENKFIDIFPARYDRPYVIFQHLKTAFGIHGVTQKIWADDPNDRHSAPHRHFWTILHLLHRHFGIVRHPVMAIMSLDETADMENCLVAPENVFKEFLANRRANPASTPHIPFCGHSLQVSAPARNGVSAGENSSLSLTPYVPCASTVHFRKQPDVLIYTDEHIPHKRHVLLRSGCGWMAISGRASVTEPVVRSFE